MDIRWDAIVIGAGPAGASCAVWLKQLGLSPLLLESGAQPGGLLRTNSYLDVWTITSPGQTGQAMAQQLARQIEISGLEMRCQTAVTHVHTHLRTHVHTHAQTHEQEFQVVCQPSMTDGLRPLPSADTVSFFARYVVVACGVSARAPAFMAGQSYPGVLVGPGEHVMQHPVEGLSVAILGGGDNAFENYLFVKSRGARSARIFARSVRAQRQFVDQVPAQDVVIGEVEVDPQARTVDGETFDRILIFYGWEPRARFLDGLDVARDERGFIQVDPLTTETSVPGLYAVGEVTQRMHPCVPTAMADGVVAAKAIEHRMGKGR